MPRSDEAEWWFNAVYGAVQEIPRGKVTSYGHIARLLGRPQCPRQVGICLKHLPLHSPNGDHYFHDQNVPWQRVVNSKGFISPRWENWQENHLYSVLTVNRGPGGAARQAATLRQEGVNVGTGALGELTIDLGTFGWFPSRLPSEAGTASESDIEAA